MPYQMPVPELLRANAWRMRPAQTSSQRRARSDAVLRHVSNWLVRAGFDVDVFYKDHYLDARRSDARLYFHYFECQVNVYKTVRAWLDGRRVTVAQFLRHIEPEPKLSNEVQNA